MSKVNVILSSIILILFFFGYLNFRQDDSYIYYTYAKNIAEGNGYVYNLGEKVNATTSPLYTLLLAVLYFIAKDISPDIFPLLGNFLAVISLATIVFCVSKLLDKDNALKFFPLLFLLNPLLKFGFGMETFFNLSLITLSVLMYRKKKFIFSAFFAGLSVLARLDSILFAAVLFLYYIITYKKLPPLKAILIFLITITPWFVFSIFYFDSFLPTSISVKLSQGNFNMFGEGFVFLEGIRSKIPGTIWSVIIIFASLSFSVTYIIIKWKTLKLNNSIKIIVLWGIALFISYAFILNAPPYPWYYTPFALPFTLIISITLGSLIKSKRYELIVIYMVFIAACLLPLKTYSEGFYPKYENYKNIAEWLNKNSRPNTTIAVDEIGILRYYYKNGKIVDVLGLVNPEVVPHLNKKDFGWYISEYQPEFIVNDYPKIMNHAGRDDERFFNSYYPIKLFQSHGLKFAVYKRKSQLN